jgi:hypothetical protein
MSKHDGSHHIEKSSIEYTEDCIKVQCNNRDEYRLIWGNNYVWYCPMCGDEL